MEYLKLFIYNKRLLSFGILLTFFSGFGKTFMLALYVGDFMHDFSLSATSFSMVYAIATVAGGVVFIYFGKFIDDIGLKKYTLFVIAGLISSCLLLAITSNVYLLLLGIWGLRLTGQGLMTHISVTAMTQRFKRCRGKAVSMAVLGHPLGEAILPLLACTVIHLYSWRTAMFISSAVMLVVLIPAVIILFRTKFKPVDLKTRKKVKIRKSAKSDVPWTVKRILSDKKIYQIAPNMFTLAFLNAGLLFFLIPIAKEKGWAEQWMIHCFTAYGIGSFLAGILTGSLIDRYRASRFFPFYLLPYAIGILLFVNFSSAYVALAYLLLAGFTIGMGNCIESSVIAEVYGIQSVGTVRSVYTSIMILSSALGPMFMGILVDHGLHFNLIMKIGVCFILISSIISLRIVSKSHPVRTALNRLSFGNINM